MQNKSPTDGQVAGEKNATGSIGDDADLTDAGMALDRSALSSQVKTP